MLNQSTTARLEYRLKLHSLELHATAGIFEWNDDSAI